VRWRAKAAGRKIAYAIRKPAVTVRSHSGPHSGMSEGSCPSCSGGTPWQNPPSFLMRTDRNPDYHLLFACQSPRRVSKKFPPQFRKPSVLTALRLARCAGHSGLRKGEGPACLRGHPFCAPVLTRAQGLREQSPGVPLRASGEWVSGLAPLAALRCAPRPPTRPRRAASPPSLIREVVL